MFLTTFTDWRTQVFLDTRVTALADLGYGVMEQALVETAAYVISPGRPQPSHTASFIRLLKDTDRPCALATVAANARAGREDPRVFRVPISEFAAVPGSPIAYWMGPSMRRLFTISRRLKATVARCAKGSRRVMTFASCGRSGR
jgi:hypothetical protein